MSILHAVPSLGESGGGPPRSVSQLCNALCEQGSSIGVVTAVDPNDPMVPLDPKIQLSTLEGRGSSLLDRLRADDFEVALDGVHQSTPISVVHQHAIWLRSSHAVSHFAHANDVPIVVAPRGMLEPWAINNSKWKKKLAAFVVQEEVAIGTAAVDDAMGAELLDALVSYPAPPPEHPAPTASP